MAHSSAYISSSPRRISLVRALLVTALYLPLLTSSAMADDATQYGIVPVPSAQEGIVAVPSQPSTQTEDTSSNMRVPLGQLSDNSPAIRTVKADQAAQLSPAAGGFPTDSRPIDNVNTGTVMNEEDRRAAVPAPNNSPAWPMATPATTQGQMTEQVVYPPEKQSAPVPVQPQQPITNTMPAQSGYAPPALNAPAATGAPRLVWVEGPKGQPLSNVSSQSKPASKSTKHTHKTKKPAAAVASTTDVSGEDQSAVAATEPKKLTPAQERAAAKAARKQAAKDKAAADKAAKEQAAIDKANAAAQDAEEKANPQEPAAKEVPSTEAGVAPPPPPAPNMAPPPPPPPAPNAAPPAPPPPPAPAGATPPPPPPPAPNATAPQPPAPAAAITPLVPAVPNIAPPAPPPPPAPAGATPPPPPPAPNAGTPPPPPPPAPNGSTPPPPPAAPVGAAAPAPNAPAAPIPAPPAPGTKIDAVKPPAPAAAITPPPAPPAPKADAASKAESDDSAAVKATANAIAQPAKITADGKTPPSLRIVFKTTETTIPLTVNDELNKLAKQLIQNDNQRVTLIAYATAAGDQASTARRISLSRALSVRAFLIDAGVNNLRINVQAEGDKNPGGEADRVDMYVQNVDATK